MEQVLYTVLTAATNTSQTTTLYVGYHDQVLLRIPSIVGAFASSPVEFTVKASINSNITALTHYFYDYIDLVPQDVKITASTGGLYELPFGGGIPYMQIYFDTACSVGTALHLVYPKVNY